jgi:predicted nucleic-acid-binding protein
LCELVWVLASVHDDSRAQIAGVVEALASSRDLRLEDHDLVQRALQDYRASNVDFADTLMGHVNLACGCEATATFDRKAARLKGFVRVS